LGSFYKKKRVFKVQRGEKPKESTINVKRRRRTSKGRTNPKLKHIKSQPGHGQDFINNTAVFNISLPVKQNSAIYPSFQNPFTAIENLPAQNIYNPYVLQDPGRKGSTDFVSSLPKY